MTRRRPRTVADLLGFDTPLARWGFTALALFSYAVDLPRCCLVCAVAAIYAWRHHR